MSAVPMMFRLSADRVKASLGSMYALLYLGVEAFGLIVLVKLLSQNIGVVQAGLISLQLYGVGLANVVLVALAVISTRSVALALALPGDLRLLQRKVMAGVAVVLGLISIGLLLGQPDRQVGLSALIFSAGVLLRGWGLVHEAERVGVGHVGADKAFLMIFSFLFFGLSCLAVQFFHASVLTVAGAYLLIGLLLALRTYRQKASAGRDAAPLCESVSWRQYSSLDKQFLAFLLMSLAGFLTMNGDVFLVSSFFGTAILAHYSIAAKIGVGIFSIAAVYPSMRLQPISAAFSAGDIPLCVKFWRECIAVAMGVGAVFALIMVLIYAPLMGWVFPVGDRLPFFYFILICVNSLIASFIAANGWPIIATGKGNLILPTWLDGVLVIALGALGATAFGVPGLLLAVTVAHSISAFMHFTLARKIFQEAMR